MKIFVFFISVAFYATCVGCACGAANLEKNGVEVKGQKNAPLELVVFSDFQCIFCKRAASEIRRLLIRHPARIKVVYRHFPISYHPEAVNAAKAAEAARIMGKFWEMHDLLFQHSKELSPELYPELAATLGLDTAVFNNHMNSAEVDERLSEDKKEATRLGVSGVPFFVINRIPFYGSYGDLEKALMDSLKGF